MIGWFKNRKRKCSVCKTETKAVDMYTINYKAVDGNGRMFVCPDCATALVDLDDAMSEVKNVR